MQRRLSGYLRDVAEMLVLIGEPRVDRAVTGLLGADHCQILDVRFAVDIVAKVFLRGGAQILRPVDAAIE